MWVRDGVVVKDWLRSVGKGKGRRKKTCFSVGRADYFTDVRQQVLQSDCVMVFCECTSWGLDEVEEV